MVGGKVYGDSSSRSLLQFNMACHNTTPSTQAIIPIFTRGRTNSLRLILYLCHFFCELKLVRNSGYDYGLCLSFLSSFSSCAEKSWQFRTLTSYPATRRSELKSYFGFGIRWSVRSDGGRDFVTRERERMKQRKDFIPCDPIFQTI